MPVKTKKITLHLKPGVICDRYPRGTRVGAKTAELVYIEYETNRRNAGTDFDVWFYPLPNCRLSLPTFKKLVEGDPRTATHHATNLAFFGEDADRAALTRVLARLESRGIK